VPRAATLTIARSANCRLPIAARFSPDPPAVSRRTHECRTRTYECGTPRHEHGTPAQPSTLLRTSQMVSFQSPALFASTNAALLLTTQLPCPQSQPRLSSLSTPASPRESNGYKTVASKKHAFPGKQRFNLMLLSFGNWQLATGYGLEATGDWGLATGNCPPATCTLYPVPSLYPCTETPANDSTATPLTGSPNHCAGSNLLESSSVSRSARVSESLGPDTMS